MTGHPSRPVPGKAVFAGLALAALAVAIAVYLGIGGFLHATNSAADSAESVERGREIAQANCAGCHAVGADGESPNPDSPPFRALKDMYPVENLEEALAEGIVTSHDNLKMPEFEFESGLIGDFIAYLKTL